MSQRNDAAFTVLTGNHSAFQNLVYLEMNEVPLATDQVS